MFLAHGSGAWTVVYWSLRDADDNLACSARVDVDGEFPILRLTKVMM
jgi:hypothetical protein